MATEKIKIFNSIIESFLLQTTEFVGTTYLNYFRKVIKLNSLIAIENAIVHVLPHRDEILNKKESYFSDEEILSFDMDKVKDINDGKFSNDTILNEIFRLKDIYYKLDIKSRDNVWDILQALVQLTIEYCEIKGYEYQ